MYRTLHHHDSSRPLEVLGSEASLHTVLRGAFSDAIDPRAVGREISELTAKEVRIGLAARDDGCAPSDQFFDLLYPDLVRDPIGAVRAIYAHFDLAFTPAAEAGMRRHLTTNPKDEHGSHDYSLAQFGLDLEEERHRYEDYRARSERLRALRTLRRRRCTRQRAL